MGSCISWRWYIHLAERGKDATRFPQLAEPVQGTAQLFSGEAAGLVVRLPGWEYPAVIDTKTGQVQYDNFQGAWGRDEELHRLLQAYPVEKTQLEAHKKGYAVSELQLQDGSIRLQLRGGA
jgi:hypothetical protein